MSVIQFESVVEGNMIRIPEEYIGQISTTVRVTLGNVEKPQSRPIEATRLASSIEKRMESVQALSGIISDDFDLDEIRTERILGK